MHEHYLLVLLPKARGWSRSITARCTFRRTTSQGAQGITVAYIGTLGDPPATSLFTCTGVGGGCGTGYGPYGPALMPGLGNTGGTGKYTINSQGSGNTSNGNNLNNTGLAINLSPQNFFFASPTVLYVADTGSPKNNSNGPDAICTGVGGTGRHRGRRRVAKVDFKPNRHGHLNERICDRDPLRPEHSPRAKLVFRFREPVSRPARRSPQSLARVQMRRCRRKQLSRDTESVTVSGWSLAYTLYNGLNLVLNSDCNPATRAAPGDLATTGLYGVTGVVNSGVATLYVTTYPNNDLVQTYLYGITDTLATTDDDKSGHSVYVAGYRSSRFHLKGSVVCADDSGWRRRHHELSVWARRLDFRHRMRSWDDYNAVVGSLDANQRVHTERHFTANCGRGTVHVL